MPSVTIRVLDDEPSPAAIEGVVVQFYSTGGVFHTSGTTDADGEVVVSLPVEEYDVLFYKVGVSILPKQPQRIEVIDPGSNVFTVTGHVKDSPESVDPLRCTVSGSILGVDGKQAIHKIVFEPVKNLLVLDGNVIAPYHRVQVESNDDGYFEFELLRNTQYNAYFVAPQDLFGQQPGKLDIVTPNQPGVALDRLLFPVPTNLDFSANAITLVAGSGQDESITGTLTYSDGSTRTATGSPWAYIKVENTNNQVVEAFLSGGKLCLLPLSAGTVTITTTRVMADLVTFNPLLAYTSESVTVTVS